ncbi:MAG: peptidase C1, partial [Thermoplasmata archaeon]|nr:peptidase C1 [Thermoplasmata archaeon]
MPQTVGVPDGICDDQYQVLISSMDKYPLKYPWGPDNIPPTEPIGLKAKFGDSYVNITWEAPGSAGGSPISNYRIYKGTESGEETYLAQIGNLLFFNDTSVINGVTYYYKISAKNALREGPQSDEISTTPATVPSAPIELNAEAGDSYINVSWNVPFNDGGSLIMNYRIYRGNTSNEFILIAKVGNFLYYEDLNVTNGINYFYKVSAQNSIGEGPLSAEISAIPLGLPSEPKSVIAIGRDSYINIYWESPISNGGSQMINYIIYKSTTPDNESYFTEIGNILYYNDTDVINGITYYYKVGAKNEVGNGPLSNEISATPASVPTAPRNLSAIAGDSFIRLSWNTPQSNGGFTITNYIIYRGTTVGKVVYLTQLGTILSYNDT